MKLSMYLWGLTWSWEELRRAFRAAESLGFSCAYIMDNVVGPKPGPAEANEKYKSADDYVAEQINASLHPEFARHYYGVYEKAIVGSPDRIIEEIKEQEKLGFDELVINPANLFSDKSAQATIREMEIIAEKILPAFE